MEVVFTDDSRKQFIGLDKSLQIRFKKALLKLKDNPIRKHLKYGIPVHVINVSKQARIIYAIEEEKVIILHCFKRHKEYEQWYKSFK